ncbi:hypothetical protein D9M71_47740 [compost metagenome]
MPANCCMNRVPLLASAERKRAWLSRRVTAPWVVSQRYCSSLSAPQALRVSRPPRVSISSAWRSAPRVRLFCTVSRRRTWMTKANSMVSGKASSGIATSGPPSRPITAIISRAKGRSIRLVRVSAVRNSRRPWKSWMLWAKPPTVAGRAFMAMPVMRSNSVAESTTSVFLPARSSRCERSTRSSSSNRLPSSRPMASTQRVATAWLGTTRS